MHIDQNDVVPGAKIIVLWIVWKTENSSFQAIPKIEEYAGRSVVSPITEMNIGIIIFVLKIETFLFQGFG